MDESGFEHASESVTDEEAIDALKGGLDDPERRKIYDAWFVQHQEAADRSGTNVARMKYAFDRAALYYKAGFKDNAIADLLETIDGIENVPESGPGRDSLRLRALELLGKMKASEVL